MARPSSPLATGTDPVVLDYVSPSAALIARRPPRAATAVVWIVLGLFGSSLAAAGLIPVDRVVASRGRLASQAATVTVQPLDTAIVRSVEVRQNQVVRAGEVLARLDPTFAAADANRLEAQTAALEAEVARLEAEVAGRPYVPGPDAHAVLQGSVHAQRQAEYAFRMENYRQRLASLQSVIERANDGARRLRERVAVAGQVEDMRRELERGRIGSRLNSLAATDTRLEVSRSLAAAEAEERSATRDADALRAERGAFATNWHATLSQLLADRRAGLAELQENLGKARLRRRLVELTAPVDSVVLELGKTAQGAVLQTGETLITLVPLNAPLEVEAEVEARDMGFIAVGDRVEIKLDAFPYVRHGTARGTVRTLSGDAFSQGQDGQQRPVFYRARISIDSLDGLRDLPPGHRLVPGAPVAADIVVGERTLLGYFFERMLRPVHEGMREP